ncbi:MAG: DUF4013 domain-containing protein [Chloroflexi bacterium]|nr:DUF4013 domain-containing protein [Chloroflexota bacterium]
MKFFPALSYPFQDPDMPRKLGLALLVAALPIAGVFIMKGWEYHISKAVRHNERRPLPGWRDIGEYLKRGFLIRFVGFLYNIPNYITLGISLYLWVRLFVQWWQSGARTFANLWAIFTDTMGPRLLVLAAALTFALLTNIFFWSGYIRYIETGKFAAFFQFIENLSTMFRTFLDDLVAALFIGIFSFITGLISTIATLLLTTITGGVAAVLAPIIFPSIALLLLTTFSGHIFGQLTRRAFGSPTAEPQRDLRRDVTLP